MGRATETGKGALGGAATGATIGSVGGPWGAAIGGAIGGVAGGIGSYLGYNDAGGDYEAQLKALAAQFGQRTIQNMGPAAQGSTSAFRQNQAALIAQLENQARGGGPSAAAIQMRDAMDRAAGAQSSAAAGAGGRGVNVGAATREAMNNTAAIQAQGARDTATLRAQEQLAATHMLGGVIGQGRGADEQMSQFNANQANEQERARVMATLQLLGLNDPAQLQALLAAMKVSGAGGPQLGTQLMAGGANQTGQLVQNLYNYKKNKDAQKPAVTSAPTGDTDLMRPGA